VSEERRKDEESQLRSRKTNILMMMRIMEGMIMMIMMILKNIILMKMMRVRSKASNFLLKKYLDFYEKIVILYLTNKKVVLIKFIFYGKEIFFRREPGSLSCFYSDSVGFYRTFL